MRHHILTLLLLLCLPLAALAQPAYRYPPFPTDPGHGWLIDYVDPSFRSSNLKTVRTLGDTIVNGRIYTLLSDGNMYRNDTVARKLYGVPRGEFLDTLIMSFDLELRDTVPDSWVMCRFPFQRGCESWGGGLPIARIGAIDTVLLAGQLRRRFQCRGYVSGPVGLFIEGIGHSRGVFEKLTSRNGQDTSMEMVCYDQEVFNPAYRSYCGPIAVRVGKISTTLEAFPNPCPPGQAVQLWLGTALPSAAQVLVCNMQGRVVLRHVLPAGKRNLPLSLARLKAGAYTVKVLHPELRAEAVSLFKE